MLFTCFKRTDAERKETSVTGWVSQIRLQWIFFCSLKGASCWALKHVAWFTEAESVNGPYVKFKFAKTHVVSRVLSWTHSMASKLTPVSGCAVHANSVVAHFVSISVSAKRKQTRDNQVRQRGTRWHRRSIALQQRHKSCKLIW